MVDQITVERIKLLHPAIKDEVMNMYVNEIVPALSGKAICRFAYTTRTFSEQAALFAQGRTRLFDANGKRLGIVTYAKPGQSFHNFKLAFDIVLLVDKDKNGTFEAAEWNTTQDYDGDLKADWMEIVNICENHGFEAGIRWAGKKNDPPHFQKTFGYTWQQLLDKYNRKDFIKGTDSVRL